MKKENISKNAVFLCTICQQEFRKIEIYDEHCIEKHSNSVKKKKKEGPRKIFMKMPINVRFVAKVLSIVGI